jgi:hypothetical protein
MVAIRAFGLIDDVRPIGAVRIFGDHDHNKSVRP